mmetsp:Transcript_4682/g.10541  ORF Transcript_4682/g.10541 Transcript_4682/m.10541 type:complete len:349 (-) Transcript_4682:237-1283(-)
MNHSNLFAVLSWLLLSSTATAFAPTTTRSMTTTSSYMSSSSSTTALHDSTQQQHGVVITGSAGGVGYAYAQEFLQRGYNVVICDVKDCQAAAQALERAVSNVAGAGSVYATQCDVSNPDSVARLGEFAQQNLGTIGYWINNAGINGGRRALSEVPLGTVEAVVKVNLLGILYCTKVAMDILGQQAGVTGHIFNTVGSGVKGGGTPGYACYGATKRGLPQLTATLVKELEEGVQGFDKVQTPGTIQVHNLSPGMVFTKLLLDDSTPELRKFPFGVLAAQPEEVAADLVPKILAANENGSSVDFLTTERILTRFFERFVLQQKSEYIDDDGNVIRMPGEQYDELGVRSLY